MRKIIILAAAALAVSCSSTQTTENTMGSYKEEAKEIISLAKNNGDKAVIRRKALNLMDTAKVLITEFKNKNPKCSNLLDFMINSSQKMTTLSLEQIEHDFHDGGALPKAPEICFEPKELLVHPATVVILTNIKFDKEGKEQIVDELEEVIAHADGVHKY